MRVGVDLLAQVRDVESKQCFRETDASPKLSNKLPTKHEVYTYIHEVCTRRVHFESREYIRIFLFGNTKNMSESP